MTALLTTLASIALLDSLSMIPICILPLAVLMAGARPALGVAAFVAGIALTYYLFGILALLGLERVLEPLNAYLLRLWQQPNTAELVIQILLGLVSLGFAARIGEARKKGAERPPSTPRCPPGRHFCSRPASSSSARLGPCHTSPRSIRCYAPT